MKFSRRSVLRSLGAAAATLPALRIPASAAPAKSAGGYPSGEPLPVATPGPFEATRASLRNYVVPEWFNNAKFGMWAHWGPQSAVEYGDWYARSMYIQGHDCYDYHCQKYGHPSKFGFKDTIPLWKAERFDPDYLIGLYKKAGARYFMSMGCHHDNFDMWNSKHNPWNVAQKGPQKDVVGMWAKAARAQGLKFGISEHLMVSYKWYSVAHDSDKTGPLAGVPYDGADPKNWGLYIDSDQFWNINGFPTDLADWSSDGIPTWFKRHWLDRMNDVIQQHEIDFLYSDGELPFEEFGLSAVANLYNTSAKRNGGKVEAVYFSKRWQDSQTGTCVLDKERGVLADISPKPWQTDTCIGEWHYKLGARYKTPKRVVDLLCDIVSRNGNLMLNIPLPASGMPDEQELDVIAEFTQWMRLNSEGIFDTRPWKVAGEGSMQTAEQANQAFNENLRKDLTEQDVRFTVKDKALYAFVMGWPAYETTIHSLATNTALQVGKIENVELLGRGKVSFQQTDKGLTIRVPEIAPCKYAVTFKINGAV
jgi:alpha-L-fucosidase